MNRLLFEKTGDAVYLSHLDLMAGLYINVFGLRVRRAMRVKG